MPNVKKVKPTDPGSKISKDEIVVIVDRSGSMSSIRADAQGGLNTFIEEQKKVENGAFLTIVEFDTRIDTLCDRVDIDEAPEYTLIPRGGTALLDAIGLVISDELKYKSEGKTIVVVVTDGGENSSKEWTRDAIFKMIETRKGQGWEFMFLASNQDAINAAVQYGFDSNSAVSFANSGEGVETAYAVSSTYTSSLRTMPKMDALAQKKAFVDAHADLLSEVGAVEEKSKPNPMHGAGCDVGQFLPEDFGKEDTDSTEEQKSE